MRRYCLASETEALLIIQITSGVEPESSALTCDFQERVAA